MLIVTYAEMDIYAKLIKRCVKEMIIFIFKNNLFVI